MSDRVSVSIDDDGIADVRLNRPDKLNACDAAMLAALDAAGCELANHGSLRAVVFSGEGRAFCAGIDLAFMGELARRRNGFHCHRPVRPIGGVWLSGICFMETLKYRGDGALAHTLL